MSPIQIWLFASYCFWRDCKAGAWLAPAPRARKPKDAS